MSSSLRSFLLVLVFAVLVPLGLAESAGCSAAQRTTEKQILDFTQTMCVLSHAPATPAVIAEACAIDSALTPYIDQVLGEQEKASFRYAAAFAPALVVVTASSASACPPASAMPTFSGDPPAVSAPASASPSASSAVPKKKKK